MISDTEHENSESENMTDDEDFMEFALLIAFPRKKKVFHERPNHFQKWNQREFFARFRLSKLTTQYILGLIEDKISSPTTR